MGLTLFFASAARAEHDGPKGHPVKVSDARGAELFKEKCLVCHDPKTGKYGNLFGLKTFDTIVGMAESEGFSDYTRRSLEDFESKTMPPEGQESPAISKEEREQLAAWLKHRAEAREQWVEKMKIALSPPHLAPGETLTFRRFGESKEQSGVFVKLLSADDFGEDAVKVKIGAEELTVSLPQIENYRTSGGGKRH